MGVGKRRFDSRLKGAKRKIKLFRFVEPNPTLPFSFLFVSSTSTFFFFFLFLFSFGLPVGFVMSKEGE
jgi:hypothetical protein